MFRILLRRSFLGSCLKQTFNSSFRCLRSGPRLPQMAIPKLIFASEALLVACGDQMENFDVELKKACDTSEKAVVDLMNFLKIQIVETCTAYEECLMQQMKIIQEATSLGPMSVKWNDLPEYRSRGIELSQKLVNLVTTLNTVGTMMSDTTVEYITEEKELVELIGAKFREVEAEVIARLKEVRKVEVGLLDVSRESILQPISSLT